MKFEEMMHILIVDDNEELVFGLKKILQEARYKVYSAFTIKDAKELFYERKYDLLLLDWMLPDGSGVELLRELRDEGDTTSVLLFSSKDQVIDKVEALDKGADDYLAKPFSNIELLARIRALLRREATQKSSRIKIADVVIDSAKREVTVADELVQLSSKEFEILELLAKNANIVLTRYQLLEHINREFDSSCMSNIVDAHIKNIRKKLDRAELIKTVRGVGYTIER